MSRSYRLRHVPRLLGTAEQFVDNVGRCRHDPIDDALWGRVAHEILRLPCKEKGQKRSTYRWRDSKHERCCIPEHLYREAAALFYRLQEDVLYPVSVFHWHPWIRHRNTVGSGVEREYWKEAHRLARHKTKIALRKTIMEGDLCERIFFPVAEDFFDRWWFD